MHRRKDSVQFDSLCAIEAQANAPNVTVVVCVFMSCVLR